jgi:hypothetical protein
MTVRSDLIYIKRVEEKSKQIVLAKLKKKKKLNLKLIETKIKKKVLS